MYLGSFLDEVATNNIPLTQPTHFPCPARQNPTPYEGSRSTTEPKTQMVDICVDCVGSTNVLGIALRLASLLCDFSEAFVGWILKSIHEQDEQDGIDPVLEFACHSVAIHRGFEQAPCQICRAFQKRTQPQLPSLATPAGPGGEPAEPAPGVAISFDPDPYEHLPRPSKKETSLQFKKDLPHATCC